ncbi:MAG: hypothetical protein IPM39_18210 [Chloroflexi bacterium]|nr:hypothetical protein [Chloroflexota bacterium]
MSEPLTEAREHFVQGMGRLTQFWGFPEGMGRMYGVVYLAPEPISLDQLAQQVGGSPDLLRANVELLEHLGMIHGQIQDDDGRTRYLPETDFWKVVRTLLKEREHNELGQALHAVGESLAAVTAVKTTNPTDELAALYETRLQTMKTFVDSLDNLIGMLISLDEMRLNALSRFFTNSKK